MKIYSVGNHKIEVSNPGKAIFPGAGIDKDELVEYYHKISGYILPYLRNRPLVMHRYPGGIDDQDFYQKEEPEYFPSWIKTIDVQLRSKEGRQKLVNCSNEATLLYIANQGCITPHVWLSKKADLEHPDKLIFDLDPPKGEFDIVLKGARDLKELFDELNLGCFVMTTGSEGLHVIVPLDGKVDFDTSRKFAKQVASVIEKRSPGNYTTQTRKDKREGRLFIDYLRNAYGQTTVAPYSLRARENAPVATPLAWEELGKNDLGPRSYHYGNIFRRLAAKEDPWRNFFEAGSSLKTAAKKVSAMIDG